MESPGGTTEGSKKAARVQPSLRDSQEHCLSFREHPAINHRATISRPSRALAGLGGSVEDSTAELREQSITDRLVGATSG